jgi:hypothetical protein
MSKKKKKKKKKIIDGIIIIDIECQQYFFTLTVKTIVY